MTSTEFINLMTSSAGVDHESSLAHGFSLLIIPDETLLLCTCIAFFESQGFIKGTQTFALRV